MIELMSEFKIIYLPASPTLQLQSFSAPILNLHDTHVSTPWIGPNTWTALVQPVAGGGIPVTQSAVELKMTFKDGGAYDFHNFFERIKERLQQAVDAVRESGQLGSGGRTGPELAGVNMANVHLEQLPSYGEANGPSLLPPHAPESS